MKKLLPLLFGSFIALLIFVAPGNPVKAAEGDQPAQPVVAQDGDCACHDVTPILGSERNKIVADLISSAEFKAVKKQYTAEGYKWLGAHDIEVIKFNVNGEILTGVPFVNSEGFMEMFVFIDGSFAGITPL
jgi:hypothetical protein